MGLVSAEQAIARGVMTPFGTEPSPPWPRLTKLFQRIIANNRAGGWRKLTSDMADS